MSPLQFELLPPVAAVELSRKLRRIPLFRFVSVDELFRISVISRQVRYQDGSTVQEKGSAAGYIQVLVQGKFESEGSELQPPAMLGFQEVLEGAPIRQTATSKGESIALVMGASDFRTLLADNIELAQGLFRMLLEDNGNVSPRIWSHARTITLVDDKDSLKTVDKALYLQAMPILSRASAEELYDLAAVAKGRPLVGGETLFSEGDPPSIVLILSGQLELQSDNGQTGPGGVATAGSGDGLGINETLAASPWNFRAQVTQDGTALLIPREPLFELLSDRVGLLQGFFGAVFEKRDSHSRETT